MNIITKTGLLITITSAVVFVAERFGGNFISSAFGKLACGEKYLQEVDGVLSELSCGFNADMYLGMFLFFFFVIGFIMILFGFVKK